MTIYSKFNIVYHLQKWMDSVPGQTFLNYAYSWGASVVILGTLFKLTHLPGANIMLFAGMGTEVFVFFLSAFDRPFDKTQDGKELPTHIDDEEIDNEEAEVEAAFKLLKENGFKGVPDEAANGGLVMVGNGANITINVNNGVIGDNNTNVGSNIINSGVNNGETINRLLSIIEAQSRQIMQLTTQLTELLLRDNNRSTKN